MDRDRLVGLWSDALVYAGAMEAEVLFFGTDGRGCFAWQNAYSTQGSTFTWRLDAGRLTTRTSRTFSNEPGQSEELTADDGWPFDLDAAHVSLAVEDGPYGSKPLVLRIHTTPDAHAYGYVGTNCPDDLLSQINQTPASR